eukprot:scaffold2334_cov118-Cylindrotheca_fusiformis.AAC.3
MLLFSFLLVVCTSAVFLVESLSVGNCDTSMKGVTNIALTVDGFIADKNGGVDWLNSQPVIEGEDFGFSEFLSSVDAILMGRNTFETVVAFGKEAWGYGETPLYVLTRGDVDNVKTADWIPETVTIRSTSSLEDFWKHLEETQGYHSVYVDGGRTIQSFLQASYMHQLTLTRIPLLLGEGIPLFDGSSLSNQVSLKHVSTKSYSNGFVTSTYDIIHDKHR